jgi:TPP-dependent pyruvate/acetoin dehydrogenase alpha subunit
MHEEWAKRDPIERYAERLTHDFGFSAEQVDGIREEVRAYVAECAEKALASPMPDPDEALAGVFAEQWEPLGDGAAPWSRWQRGETAGNGHRRAPVERRAA